MPQSCPRCNRANPDQAIYCYHDGNILRQASGAVPPGQLSHDFVFPSGRRCRTYEELVQGCYLEWEDARNLLHDGTFAGFLAGQGRADLARVARETEQLADRDIALTNFITALPAPHVHGPKLGLEPRRLAIGPLRVGEQRPIQLKVLNEGKALLQGKLTIGDDIPWLTVSDGQDRSAFAIHTPRDQTVNLRLDTTGLVVGQNYSARLVVVTNGGVAEVPVRLDLVARAFPLPPYQGVTTPRDLARRMRDAPQPAVSLLESGEVARWFAANGWTYPVAGGTAPGLASVQQFFEELGLAKAPAISISDQEVHLRCALPVVPSGQVTIRSATRKLVYGRAESDSPWLKPNAALVSGQMHAAIGFTLDPAHFPENRTYQGTLRIIANAGQSFPVRVIVDVTGATRVSTTPIRPNSAPILEPSPPTSAPDWLAPAPSPRLIHSPIHSPAPPGTVARTPLSAIRTVQLSQAISEQVLTPASDNGHGVAVTPLQGFLVGALLGMLVRSLLVLPADLYARLLGTTNRVPAPGSLQAWLQPPPADEGFLRLFVLATWWIGPILGAWLVWRQGGKWSDLVCGILAGAVAGLAGFATMGCLLVAGDTVPRQGLSILFGQRTLSPALATPLWILASVSSWLVLGALAGLILALGGNFTRGVLEFITSPISHLLRMSGLAGMADFFSLRD